jgi:hypothetical protein
MGRLDVYRQSQQVTESPRLSQSTAPTYRGAGASMIYDIGMPHKDFLQAEALVKDITRRCYTRELTMITQDRDKLSGENREYLDSDMMALGVTFMDVEAKKFSIWLSPALRYWDSPWTVDTVLHELTHGYANAMNHGQRFRRTLITALHRYENEIQPIKADFMARRMVNQYSEDEWQTRQYEMEFAKKAALRA